MYINPNSPRGQRTISLSFSILFLDQAIVVDFQTYSYFHFPSHLIQSSLCINHPLCSLRRPSPALALPHHNTVPRALLSRQLLPQAALPLLAVKRVNRRLPTAIRAVNPHRFTAPRAPLALTRPAPPAHIPTASHLRTRVLIQTQRATQHLSLPAPRTSLPVSVPAATPRLGQSFRPTLLPLTPSLPAPVAATNPLLHLAQEATRVVRQLLHPFKEVPALTVRHQPLARHLALLAQSGALALLALVTVPRLP